MKGWTLEKGDCTIVNTPDCGQGRYKVALWCGSGYLLDHFLCYANSEEEALEQVVVYLERTNSGLLQDDCYKENLRYEMQEHGLSEDEAADQLDLSFMWVDATMSGAQRPHYIFLENMRVQTVPEQYYDWFNAA
ncbi:MAG: hypothetical protein IJ640_00065 [Prevotella sp.]|nr:hypothetical protein [Prevotella sp.]